MSYPNQSQPFDPGRPAGGQDPNRPPAGSQPPGFSGPPARGAAEPFIVDEGEYQPGPTDDTRNDPRDEAKRVASDAADRSRDVADTAKQEGAAMADTAKAEGRQVLGSAKDEAGHVMDEAKHQTRRIVDEGVGELKQQAEVGQRRIAEVVRSFSGELHTMTDSATESGPAVELVGRVQRFGDDAADWLEQSRPEEVLDSVRRFAARKPWTFLAISAGVGFLGARLVRSLSDADEPDGRSSSARGGRHLDAPSYSDDGQRLGRGSQQVGGAPLAQDVRGEHHSRPDDWGSAAPGRGARGGDL